MGDCHLRQRTHQQQREAGAQEITRDYRWPGRVDGQRTTKEEPGPDRSSNRNHAHLPRAQLAREACFLGEYGSSAANLIRGCYH